MLAKTQSHIGRSTGLVNVAAMGAIYLSFFPTLIVQDVDINANPLIAALLF